MQNIVPNFEKINSKEKNVNGTMIAQLIIFYIGVAAFFLVCCIPPFTIFLPILVPIIMMVVVYVNFSFFGKNINTAIDRTVSLANKTKKIVIDSMKQTAELSE